MTSLLHLYFLTKKKKKILAGLKRKSDAKEASAKKQPTKTVNITDISKYKSFNTSHTLCLIIKSEKDTNEIFH